MERKPLYEPYVVDQSNDDFAPMPLDHMGPLAVAERPFLLRGILI